MLCFFHFYYALSLFVLSFFFFFNDTATTEIYTLSLHDALPILDDRDRGRRRRPERHHHDRPRSEEHTSELQSPDHLVCRLLLEKKKKHRRTRLLRLSRYCRTAHRGDRRPVPRGDTAGRGRRGVVRFFFQ